MSRCREQRSSAVPMILLTRARSGSTATCELLAKATGSLPELLWSEPFEPFFGFKTESHNASSILAEAKQLLCPGDPWTRRLQRLPSFGRLPASRHLVGFKWKPYWHDLPEFDLLWRWVARHDVPVVFLTRNVLDVALHEMKHRLVPGYDACQARRADSDCTHLRRAANMQVNTSLLSEELTWLSLEDRAMHRKLSHLRVSYTNASHESLFGIPEVGVASDAPDVLHARRTAAWRQLLDYLGFQNAQPPPIAAVTISHSSEHARGQLGAVHNPDEVRDALAGAGFGSLLRPLDLPN
jgi:hypothetical protein